MTRTYLKLNGNKWDEVDKSDFWIDTLLLSKLKGVEMIQSKGWDAVIVVDGKERSGKSVLGMIMGWYLTKGNLTLDNFARGLSDAAEKIGKLPDKSVLIVDEASTVFASKDSMSEEGKQLIKIMDVVGQKNMVFILCLPCFFDLNKTMAVRRSLFLCHTYPDEAYDRGQYAYWSERSKKNLYIFGKKNYDSYKFPPADFIGEYMAFEPPFYTEYKEIVKRESLKEVLDEALRSSKRLTVDQAVRLREARIAMNLKSMLKLTNEEVAKIFEASHDTIKARLNTIHGIKPKKIATAKELAAI